MKARPAAPARPPLKAQPKSPKPAAAARSAGLKPLPRPALDRARRQLPAAEREAIDDADARLLSSVRAGSDDLQHQLAEHTESSPALTAGDVDANWGDAYAVGDEAPGGDNPTPDQDVVDEIGKALGVNYEDGEELKGSEKIIERDRHRWELDPASSDDWPHDKD